MHLTQKAQFKKIKKCLGIKKIVSIRFSDSKGNKYKKYKDTACTALARSFKKEVSTYVDRKLGQLCPGGDYFLKITRPTKREVCKVYVSDEGVFKKYSICSAFLKTLPKYPLVAQKRYILFTPLAEETQKPDVISLLATPAQVGRILGLSAYKKISFPLVIPAGPTFASIYAPILTKKIHINFIDYFDRYYQGKLFWNDSDLIVSLSFGIFKQILATIPLSAHGIRKPRITPQQVDPL